MSVLLDIHSILRWVIVVLAVVLLVKFLVGWLQKSSFERVDVILGRAFSGLMDLQATIGLIFLIATGVGANGVGFPRTRLEHAFTMILAAVAAHFIGRWKGASGEIRFRNSFLVTLLTSVLVYVGVLTVGGWTR
ncbi:MAG: hypothetical protein KDE51_11700 [Anaerolineales bacterium]|nr:hypothetical protein [Anaerolineales bacterium]